MIRMVMMIIFQRSCTPKHGQFHIQYTNSSSSTKAKTLTNFIHILRDKSIWETMVQSVLSFHLPAIDFWLYGFLYRLYTHTCCIPDLSWLHSVWCWKHNTLQLQGLFPFGWKHHFHIWASLVYKTLGRSNWQCSGTSYAIPHYIISNRWCNK